MRDDQGRDVEVTHKGAKATRLAHVTRRGAMTHPFYALSQECLRSGEDLQPHHVVKGDTCTQLWAVVEGDVPKALLLGTVTWEGDGITNAAKDAKSLHRSLPNELKNRFQELFQ